MDFASRPNGSSHWPWPTSDVGTILLQSAMSTQHQLGSLTQGIESIRADVADIREQLSDQASTHARIDRRLEHLEAKASAPPPSPLPSPPPTAAPPPPPAPEPSSSAVTISIPAYHLAAMVGMMVLGLVAGLAGPETKEALLPVIQALAQLVTSSPR